MKKETLVAIFLGLLFGGAVAVLISFKNKDIELTKNKVIAPPKEKTVPLNLSKTKLELLELTEPINGVIVKNNTVRFKGTALKDSLIVIQSPLKDLVFNNKQKKFDVEFPLVLGENSIKMVVYPKEKQFKPQEKFIKVYFIDSEL